MILVVNKKIRINPPNQRHLYWAKSKNPCSIEYTVPFRRRIQTIFRIGISHRPPLEEAGSGDGLCNPTLPIGNPPGIIQSYSSDIQSCPASPEAGLP